MAAVVLLIGILQAGLALAGLSANRRREPRPRPISNAEWFEQRRRGIRHPHAEIPPVHDPLVTVYRVLLLATGLFLITDACMRLEGAIT